MVENQAQQPARTNGCEQYRVLVSQYTDWNVDMMLEIMKAESGCRPQANNAGTNTDGTTDCGILQVNSIHGYSCSDLYNPEFNIQVAHKIWLGQGYKAWSSYNNKHYLRFQ